MKSSRRRSFLSPSFPGHRAVCVSLWPPQHLFGENRHTNCCFAQSWGARPWGPAGFTSTVNMRLTASGSGRRKHDAVSWLEHSGKQLEPQSPGPQSGEVPPLTDVGFTQGHWPGSNPCQPLPNFMSSSPCPSVGILTAPTSRGVGDETLSLSFPICA